MKAWIRKTTAICASSSSSYSKYFGLLTCSQAGDRGTRRVVVLSPQVPRSHDLLVELVRVTFQVDVPDIELLLSTMVLGDSTPGHGHTGK